MKFTKNTILIATGLLFVLTGCKKEGCTDPLADNYNEKSKTDDGSCEYSYSIPTTYVFTDTDGNNTVSFSGQTARMDMLSEMVTYLKSANGSNASPATLDAATLLSMYDNSYTGWDDAALVGNGKKLKNKTALNDAAIQAQFETWMTEAAAASPSSNGTYLQAATGQEWTQLIEKGLMSACFASQLTGNYLAGITGDDNVTADEPAAGKYYTEMEHHWDEAYGYFTDTTDYPAGGTDRFWGKYANNTLEPVIGSATNISNAFRAGRAAIAADRLNPDAGFTADAVAQAAIIETEVQRMVAGMAIHYLNDVKAKVAGGIEPQTKINHSMSEAWAFIYGIQFVNNSPMNSSTISTILAAIDTDFEGYTQNVTLINADIDAIANAHGLSSYKDQL